MNLAISSFPRIGKWSAAWVFAGVIGGIVPSTL
jgi:hypothetical protein